MFNLILSFWQIENESFVYRLTRYCLWGDHYSVTPIANEWYTIPKNNFIFLLTYGQLSLYEISWSLKVNARLNPLCEEVLSTVKKGTWSKLTSNFVVESLTAESHRSAGKNLKGLRYPLASQRVFQHAMLCIWKAIYFSLKYFNNLCSEMNFRLLEKFT